MGRFDDCRRKVMFDGQEENWYSVGCVISVLLSHGGADKHLLQQDELERVKGLSVGPFQDLDKDDPAQDYALVQLEDPHQFRLVPAASFNGLADIAGLGAP